MGEGA